jgi:hypothetical protein
VFLTVWRDRMCRVHSMSLFVKVERVLLCLVCVGGTVWWYCVGEFEHSYAAHGNGGAFGEMGVSVLIALRTFMLRSTV